MSEDMVEQGNAMPRIGEKAPAFKAVTTHGEVTNETYKGKWYVLFSHPSDFTPVCTTEFVSFQSIYPELKEMGVELLGLSIDSLHSHIAWVRNIKQNFNISIEFPIIADLSREVAKKFGMLMPGENSTEATRAVFAVDPDGVIQAIIYYPLNIGRNMDEILRLVQALQAAREHEVAVPADWRPGQKVIVPPPQTQQDADARSENDEYEYIDWYLSKKDI